MPQHGRPFRQAHPKHRAHRWPVWAASTLLLLGTILAAQSVAASGDPPTGSTPPTTASGPVATNRVPASPVVAPSAASELLTPPVMVPPLIPTDEPADIRCLGPAPAAAKPAAPALTGRPVAVFLGDSYTTGYNGYGLGDAGWPARVSGALHLQRRNLAVAGTGFVNPGWTAQPVRTRVATAIAARPQVVFLAAGHNDRSYGAEAALRAATPVIDRLRRELPDAALVIIGPIWQSGSVPASLRSLNDGLRRLALSSGAIFVDAIRGGWFAGSAQRLISGDGIHPTDAGHRRIAEQVLAALAADPAFGQRLDPQPAATPYLPAALDRCTYGNDN